MRPALCALLVLGGCAVGPSPSPEPTPADPAGSPCPACPRCPDAPASGNADVELPKGLSYACEAQLGAHQEISRLLVAATAHATTSGACVDGPGKRITADEILVCPTATKDADTRAFKVAYRITVRPEGDTRGCGGSLEACGMNPTSSRHDAELSFKKAKRGWLIQIPDALPGIEGMTALGEEHDGDCYGTSSPFKPIVTTLK